MTSFTRRTTPTQTTQVLADDKGRLRFERGIQESISTRPVSSVRVSYIVQLPDGSVESGEFSTSATLTFSEFLLQEFGVDRHSDNVLYEIVG